MRQVILAKDLDDETVELLKDSFPPKEAEQYDHEVTEDIDNE